MARKVFGTGTIVRSRITFTDPDTKVATDPVSITVTARQPTGTSTTYVYGVDAEVVRVSTGVYTFLVTLASVGTHKWKWIGSGTQKSVVVYDECDSEKEAGF